MEHPQDMSEKFLPSLSAILIVSGLIVVLVAIAFSSSISHGFSTLDDSYLIYNNLAIRGPTLEHLRAIFTTFDPELYIPGTLFSYQLNFLIGGLNAGIYHFTNLLLHAANALLVAWLLLLFTRKKWAALLGGLIFAVHPLHTEAVVWIAGRKDLLSTFFLLLSLIAYLASTSGGSRQLYWLSIVLFALALLSKVMVLTLPAVILLYELLIKRERWQTTLKKLVPYAVLSGIFAAVALLGKQRIVSSSTLAQTMLMAAKSAVFYLGRIFFPVNLTVFYPYQKAITVASPDFFIPLIILILLAGIAIWSLKWTRWVLFGFLFYLITLSPTFLNFHKGETVFFAVDRYAYLPSVGIILLIVLACSWLAKKLSGRGAMIIDMLSGVMLATLVILSFFQTKVWRTDEDLFAHALLLYPESVAARTNLAAIYHQSGRISEEKTVLSDGLTYQRDVSLLTGLGSIEAGQNNLAAAQARYDEAKKLDPKNPEPYFFLGSLEEQRKNVVAAIADYEQATKLDDSYVAAHNNLGAIYMDQGKLLDARSEFERALSYNPNFMEGHYNLFQILEMQHEFDAAFAHLEKAYALNPDSPDIVLAIAYRYSQRRRSAEAIAALNQLLGLDPANAAAKHMLNSIESQLPGGTTQSIDERQLIEQRKQRRLQEQSKQP